VWPADAMVGIHPMFQDDTSAGDDKAEFEITRVHADGKLAPGMVTTVEPGCYIRPGAGVPERFAGIGVRIEDDVAVTPAGAEVLTRDAPTSAADIEVCMGTRDG